MRWGDLEREEREGGRERERDSMRARSKRQKVAEGEFTPLSARLISGSCQPGRRGSPFEAEGLFNVQTSSRKPEKSRPYVAPKSLSGFKNRGTEAITRNDRFGNSEEQFWHVLLCVTQQVSSLYCGKRCLAVFSSSFSMLFNRSSVTLCRLYRHEIGNGRS